jgi:hypothetical protein
MDFPVPAIAVASDRYDDEQPIPTTSVLIFLLAVGRACLNTHFVSLENRVSRVKRRHHVGRARHGGLDLDKAKRLVAEFGRLRTFFFSSRNACLFETLALIEFLALHKVYVGWFFGVRAEPFVSHCWAQEGEVIFNESIELIGTLVPIMAV